MQDTQGLVDAENGRDSGEHVDVQGHLAVLARHLYPVLVGRARRQAEDEAALLLGQSPEIGNGQERAQARRAQTAPIGRVEALGIQAIRPRLDLGSGDWGALRHGWSCVGHSPYLDMIGIVSSRTSEFVRSP